MSASKNLLLTVLMMCQLTSFSVLADVFEVSGGFKYGHYVAGANLTQEDPLVELRGEWSSNNGGLVSLSCFGSENGRRIAIQRGCVGRLGWFVPLNEKNALTLAVSRHDYSGPVLSGWEYTDVSLHWHLGHTYRFELTASDSWLGQGFSALTSSFHVVKPVTDKWRLKLEAGITTLQNSAPVDALEYGGIGAEYGQDRWVAEFQLRTSSSDYRRYVKLELKQPDVAMSFRYRFY